MYPAAWEMFGAIPHYRGTYVLHRKGQFGGTSALTQSAGRLFPGEFPIASKKRLVIIFANALLALWDHCTWKHLPLALDY